VPTVDGPRWVKERLRFLEQQLEQNPEHEQRVAIEAEIEQLHSSSDAPRRGWLRWLGLPRMPR
jgi:hypothetical protein